jgi:hypothetical protein
MRKAIGAVLWGLAVGGVFGVLLLAARIITQVDFKADLGAPSARSQGETPVIEVQALPPTSPSQGETENGTSGSPSAVGGGGSSEIPVASSTSGRFRVISSQPANDTGTANPSAPTDPTSPPSPTSLAPSDTDTTSDTKYAKKNKSAKSKGKAKEHGHKSGDKKQGKGSGKAHHGGTKQATGGSSRPATAGGGGTKTHPAASGKGHKGGGKAHKGRGATKHSGKHNK